ncbi:MAG TPA: MBL fold metallo-hydrolase [Polyangiaceae bacterium]|nr:MBL fold metallo-hydrolase [Polyangiaceae bacterium]
MTAIDKPAKLPQVLRVPERARKVKPFLRRFGRFLLGLVAASILLTLVLLVDGWRAFGHRAEGQRLERMQRSPQFRDGHFVNPQPLVNHLLLMFEGLLHVSPNASPSTQIPTVAVDPKTFVVPPVSGLRVTWLGHATTLIEIDGKHVLTDPVWSERASPFTWIGPRRWYTPRISLAELPVLDAVVISHDHYDHLDYRTMLALNELISNRGWATRFVVPLGIGAHLAYWGIPESRIVELDWWEKTSLGEAADDKLEIVCTPARHASGRMLLDNDAKLWASYALIGPAHRAYFSGDTGLFPALRDIGQRLGPFDLTLIEVGQYHGGWPDWHIGPEQALTAHQWLRGRVFVPIHWGLFALAYHGWTEPAERVIAAARTAQSVVILPMPGESVEPSVPEAEARASRPRWWPKLPWQSAAEAPIVSTQIQ